MTGMMDFYDKIKDILNEPAEANDNPPDFGKSLESEECPFCYNGKCLIYTIIKNKKEHRNLIRIYCPLCKRHWAFEHNELTGEIIIIGEVDNPFGPDDLE